MSITGMWGAELTIMGPDMCVLWCQVGSQLREGIALADLGPAITGACGGIVVEVVILEWHVEDHEGRSSSHPSYRKVSHRMHWR